MSDPRAEEFVRHTVVAIWMRMLQTPIGPACEALSHEDSTATLHAMADTLYLELAKAVDNG